MDRSGQRIATRYQLLKFLDQGAMGEVYRARDLRLNTVVAVKFLKHALHSPAMCDRFFMEAKTCAQLSYHSNHIVQVTDFGTDLDGIPFLVMEYLQGQSLKDCLQSQPLRLSQFLQWVEQICLGLNCAHAGIEMGPNNQRSPVIHADLKPSNIFICPDETVGVLVKILDFGVARLMQDDNLAGTFVGTLPYCSPEQMMAESLDPRSDIYSLGIVMFEMLTGQYPIHPATHTFSGWFNAHHTHPPRPLQGLTRELRVPPELDALVMACLAKSSQDRPQAIAEVLGVIRSLQEATAVVNAPTPLIRGHHPLAKTDLDPQETIPVDQPLVFPSAPDHQPILCQPVLQPQRMPALWVKLPHEEIQAIQIYRLYNEVYQNFLFCQPPKHPALLWITAIGNPQIGVRWLPCYLDLRTRQGLDLMYLLGNTTSYQYLFFDTEHPHWLSHQITRQLEPERRQQIQQAAVAIQSQPSGSSFLNSREQLSAAYLNLRRMKEPEILETIQSRWRQG